MSSITTLMQNLADMRDAVTAERETTEAERQHLMGRLDTLANEVRDLKAALSSFYQNRDASLVGLEGGNGEPAPNVALAG